MYQTYLAWRRAKSKELAKESGCTLAEAEECLDPDRWFSECIEPAMREGGQPTLAVIRSLVKHCKWSLTQLDRMFVQFHNRPMRPEYVGDDGRLIKKTFNVSGLRQRKKKS